MATSYSTFGQQHRSAYAILLTPRNSNGTCTWCVVQDITITHNLIQHANDGIEIGGGDTPGSGQGGADGYSLATY